MAARKIRLEPTIVSVQSYIITLVQRECNDEKKQNKVEEMQKVNDSFNESPPSLDESGPLLQHAIRLHRALHLRGRLDDTAIRHHRLHPGPGEGLEKGGMRALFHRKCCHGVDWHSKLVSLLARTLLGWKLLLTCSKYP